MKFKIATLVGVLALVASSAFAGERVSWLAVNGGAAFPSSDLSDLAGTGWLAGLGGGMTVAKNCAVGVDVNYLGFGKKTIQTVDVQPKVWQYDVAGYYMFPMKDKTQYPYLKLGIGAYSIDPDVSGVASKTLFGGNVGLGYNKALSAKNSLGLEVLYHWISQSDEYTKVSDPNSKASLSVITVAAHYGFALGGGK